MMPKLVLDQPAGTKKPRLVLDEPKFDFGTPPITDALEPDAEELEKYRRMGVKQYRSVGGTLYDLTKPSTAPPEQEEQFQQWYTGWAEKLGLNPDPDHPLQQYDYRSAFEAGAKPDETGH